MAVVAVAVATPASSHTRGIDEHGLAA